MYLNLTINTIIPIIRKDIIIPLSDHTARDGLLEYRWSTKMWSCGGSLIEAKYKRSRGKLATVNVMFMITRHHGSIMGGLMGHNIVECNEE